MVNNHILIIDDDEKLNERLHKYLGTFGYDVRTAADPREGLAQIDKARPDLLILDVMLPEMDGFEVIRRVRKSGALPVIMLTARGDVTDRIVGLELGADDYLPKPFDPRELVARIQTVLRRTQSKPETVKSMIKFDDMMVNLQKRSVDINGESITLTALEFDILEVFIRNAGVVLDRDYLLDQVRGIDWEAYNRSIDVLISRLRQKLHDDPKQSRYIKTVWGTGYMFIGEEEDGD